MTYRSSIDRNTQLLRAMEAASPGPWRIDGMHIVAANGVIVARVMTWQPDQKDRPRSAIEVGANARILAEWPTSIARPP